MALNDAMVLVPASVSGSHCAVVLGLFQSPAGPSSTRCTSCRATRRAGERGPGKRRWTSGRASTRCYTRRTNTSTTGAAGARASLQQPRCVRGLWTWTWPWRSGCPNPFAIRRLAHGGLSPQQYPWTKHQNDRVVKTPCSGRLLMGRSSFRAGHCPGCGAEAHLHPVPAPPPGSARPAGWSSPSGPGPRGIRWESFLHGISGECHWPESRAVALP